MIDGWNSIAMVTTKILRSNTGCWTCRTRRKKCDEKGIPCLTCEALNIICYGYGQRPNWMDGGERERMQARAFKAAVKRTNILRRQSKSQDISTYMQNTQYREIDEASDHAQKWPSRRVTSPAYHTSSESSPVSQTIKVSDDAALYDCFDDVQSQTIEFDYDLLVEESSHSSEASFGSQALSGAFAAATTPSSIPVHCQSLHIGINDGTCLSRPCPPLEHPNEIHSDTVVRTLQKVSIIGPYDKLHNQNIEACQSSETGILHVVDSWKHPPQQVSKEDSALRYFKEAMIPSVFPFMTVRYAHTLYEQIAAITNRSAICRSATLAVSTYHQQLQLKRFGLGSKQEEEFTYNHEHVVTEALGRLPFESSINDHGPCDDNTRIDVQYCSTQILLSKVLRGSKDWLRMINTLSLSNPISNERPLGIVVTFHQHLLVLMEILACTFTNADPKFSIRIMQTHTPKRDSHHQYHATGLGCGLISSLLQIVQLRRWKQHQLSINSLSMTELAKRGLYIENELQEQLQGSTVLQAHEIAVSAFTRVYASAASIFLQCSISQSHPQIPEIKRGVAEVITSLQLLPRPDLLKRLAWPVCIAACMSSDPGHVEFFIELSRRVTAAYGEAENISRALVVAQECWRLRDCGQRDARTYDWVDAMKSLGVLLLLY